MSVFSCRHSPPLPPPFLTLSEVSLFIIFLLKNWCSRPFFFPSLAPPTAASPPSSLGLTRPLSSLGFSKLEAVAGARCPSVTAASCHRNGRHCRVIFLLAASVALAQLPLGGGMEGKKMKKEVPPLLNPAREERDCQIWRQASSSSLAQGIMKMNSSERQFESLVEDLG